MQLAPASPLRRARARAQAAPAVLALVPLAAAIVLWLVSLGHIDTSSLGLHGLPPALPLSWYAAMAILAVGTAALCWAERPNGWLIAAYAGALVILINATVPAITDVPHYPWVYKHIGVARYIQANGGVDLGADLYHRWPAFFALAAAFSRWAGTDPLSIAAWAEPGFAVLETMIVAAVAYGVSRDKGTAGFAALMFMLGNWISQTYFAPQTSAYIMGLGLVVVLVRRFFDGEPLGWAMRLMARITRRPQDEPAFHHPQPWSRGWSLALVVLLDLAVVATHQLTPYVLAMQVGVLTVAGFVRPRWLILVLGALTIGYLLPNLGFIVHRYGLFDGINPADNVKHGNTSPVGLTFYDRNAGGLLSVTLILLMFASALRLALLGRGRVALALILLAITPFGILFAQNYGGEASLRVFLFSSPWRDVVIAMGIATIAHRGVRLAASIVLLGVLVTFFLPAFYGKEELYIMPKDEVRASEYFYAHAPAGSVLVLSAANFPVRVGARYTEMKGPESDDGPNVTGNVEFQGRPLGPADKRGVIDIMKQYSPQRRGFIEFSTSSYANNELYALTPPGQLNALEAAIRDSHKFTLFYNGPDTRIYEWNGR